ncbi:MMPL family RND transporter, partial [Mycolicibacterium sphagni]|nr:MMPL family RND transporter [Mycolicibacterium sphagni]
LAVGAEFNYDDRKAVAASAPSSIGYAALERHFPISQSIPQYLLVQSERDLRTPQALADLEQMASRIAQLPDIALVSGVTRPLGEVPPEFRATFQAGIVGARLAEGTAMIGERGDDLTELATGANTLADTLGEVRAQVNAIAPSLQTLLDAFSSVRTEYGGDKLVRDVETAAELVQAVNELGNSMGVNFANVKNMFGWIGPVLQALQGNAVCDANPSCRDTRLQFQ